MSAQDETWVWKDKNHRQGDLLYEPGSWGDLLKLSWLTAIVKWQLKAFGEKNVSYLDMFAGSVEYPAGNRVRTRLEQANLENLAFLEKPFFSRNRWPSAAAAAERLLPDPGGQIRVFDADPDRQAQWRGHGKFAVCEGDTGWALLEREEPRAAGLWMVDPYDFRVEWRERLAVLAGKSRDVSIIVYIFNRSAKEWDLFRDYREFRNRLDELRSPLPKCLGRAAADGFLARSHHEILYLPSEAAAKHPFFPELVSTLRGLAVFLDEAIRRSGIFET